MNRYLPLFFCLLLLSACNSPSAPAGAPPEEPFRSLLAQMTQGIQTGQPDLISSVYADNAYIIGHDGVQANGKLPIKKYWRELAVGATDWKLDIFQSARSMDQLTAGKAWKALEAPLRTPQSLGFKIDTLPGLVYQLGRSELTFEREGQTQQSVVDFLLVWAPEGDQYRILLDIYR